MIQFACPGCGAIYAVEDAKAGKTGLCPKCQSQFIIPGAETPAAPPPAPPSQIDLSAPPAPPPSPPAPQPPPPPASDPNEPVEVSPCPSCGTRLSVLASDLGVNVECPQCKTVFLATRPGSNLPVPSSRQSGAGRSGGLDDVLSGGSGGSRRRDDDDRPSRRRSRDDEEDDDRPSRRSRRGRRDDDDRPSRRSRDERPGNISVIGGMLLGGGIYGLLYALGVGASVGLSTIGICCLWPGWYFEIVAGIMAIVRGSQMLQQGDRGGPPRTHCILLIICIVNFDVIAMVLGIVGLVLLNNPDVQEYYERQGFE